VRRSVRTGGKIRVMTRAARKPKVDSAREALARAPVGPPLSDEERERLEAVGRRGTVESVSHDAVMRELAERQRRGS